MPALVDVADVDLDIGRKDELLGKLELDTGHGIGWRMKPDYPECFEPSMASVATRHKANCSTNRTLKLLDILYMKTRFD